jgi:hypothetical protein
MLMAIYPMYDYLASLVKIDVEALSNTLKVFVFNLSY